MTAPLDAAATAALFGDAHTAYGWTDRPVEAALIQTLYDLVKVGPTSANSSPARFAFCTSPEARERLAACVSANNAPRVRAAPVTVVIGMDMAFYDRLPELFPYADARSWFAHDPVVADATALRNSSLQGGYLILAARALGLDAGPMSGFDKDAVDAAFWAGTTVATNFICSLGYADHAFDNPRPPKLSFEDAAQIL
ncbi:malonic semialdehyde reductase [Glacieibacterium frigidum]|uniref:Putative NADH dehydrogenase/NAD(P)H nitroreductase FMM06_14585 n=1 Tax=Glacieibacterium frigidum TaxID=2593303 RepID=A0A552U9K1_9SPHN|nr:malonic semialdehyde reductase [Glacieibacterium frigidum]TRW14892.1 malonic semialdehyde reductase [Glacieibacterium frigidum]